MRLSIVISVKQALGNVNPIVTDDILCAMRGVVQGCALNARFGLESDRTKMVKVLLYKVESAEAGVCEGR